MYVYVLVCKILSPQNREMPDIFLTLLCITKWSKIFNNKNEWIYVNRGSEGGREFVSAWVLSVLSLQKRRLPLDYLCEVK